MKSAYKPLATCVLIPLGLTAAVLIPLGLTDTATQKENVWMSPDYTDNLK